MPLYHRFLDDRTTSLPPDDLANLFIGVAVLLGSMWLARRGTLIRLRVWPGAPVFVPYSYIVYVFAMPLNAALLSHLALVSMSVDTLMGPIVSIDGKAVCQRHAPWL